MTCLDHDAQDMCVELLKRDLDLASGAAAAMSRAHEYHEFVESQDSGTDLL